MTAIFLFDILAALSLSIFGDFTRIDAKSICFLAGTAINDTSSVAAAEATYNVLNNLDINLAITVKLTRITMLIAVAVVFTIITFRKETKMNDTSDNKATSTSQDTSEKLSVGQTVLKVFPKFILVFIFMAILNTVGVFQNISGASTFSVKAINF